MNFNEYQKKSQETWISNTRGFIRAILGICGESGEIAEKIKKFYRDGHSNLRNELKKELGDLLYYIARCADYMQLSLEDIAKQNLRKLQSRKKRNKIKGSGDER